MPAIIEDIFGSTKDPITGKLESIRRFTFTNEDQMSVQVITLGATITSIRVPDKKGLMEDVVLGHDTIDGYADPKTNPYFGATIGRVANRIKGGNFKIGPRKVRLSCNLEEKHHLHGGVTGFNRVIWSVRDLVQETCTLKLQYISPDNQEGYPGRVTTTVRFSLATDNCFHIRMMATSSQPTPVNLTNHTYFNLAGHSAGRGAVYDTKLFIKADKILDTDFDNIPTGRMTSVEGTAYDFKELKELGPQMMKLRGEGFDDTFCVNLRPSLITVVAKASCPRSGRWLELAADKPGLQFYTANNLPCPSAMENPIVGRDGAEYWRQGAFCLEPEDYPDAVNHEEFPSIMLEPGRMYEHNILYKFGVDKDEEVVHEDDSYIYPLVID